MPGTALPLPDQSSTSPEAGALPGAEPSAPALATPPGARVVVVAGTGTQPTDDDAGQQRRTERRQLARRLDDASLAAVIDISPMLGGGLLALGLLAAPTALNAWPWPAVAAWVLLLLASAVGLISQPMQRRPRRPGRRLPWALAGAAAAVLLPLLAPASAGLPLPALGASLTGLLAVAALSARRRWWPWAVPMAPLACVAVALSGQPGSPWWWAAAALSGLLGGLLGHLRHQHWRLQMIGFIQQADRVAALERERDDAIRANLDKSRFLAIASHDLRQPVHALGLFAATLQRRLQQSPDEPLARNLMRAVDGLERSFNAMLDISRLDGGALTPQPQTFPLRDMFRRLHMHFGGQAELAGLGLRFSPGGKWVTSDPQLLERIVGNLVQNAIKYTDRGGIVVVARSTATHINVEIWDTGCGIAPAELPRVFDEFYQIGRGERDRTHGLGMGLAIVKRLAALLGHRLEVASVPGRGTMFRVGLPIGGLPGIQEEMAPADTLPMAASSPQMVLVVDDEEPIREGLRLLLQEWGYQAMTAADALQAESAVTALEGHVDLVLSDLHLGDGADGQELIARVRRLCGREVPAILVTGETAAAQVQRMAASGDPVLFKPVQPRQLFEAIRAALG